MAVMHERAEGKASPESAFRDSLEDVLTILQRIMPYCTDGDDLMAVLQLAMNSPAQARFLMTLISSPEGRTAPARPATR